MSHRLNGLCSLLFVSGLTLAGMLLAAPGQAQTYTFQDLGTIPGAFNSIGNSINASGEIAGNYDSSAGGPVAFHTTSTGTLDDGTATDLGVFPGGDFSRGLGINDSGQVTGYSETASSDPSLPEHAFRTSATNKLSDGSATDLGVLPGGGASVGNGINASGQVTGFSVNGSVTHAFRTTGTGTLGDGTATDLGTFAGGSNSVGNGINGSGQVTGFADVNSKYSHAFRTTGTGTLDDGTATDLGVLAGDLRSEGKGINASGQVTGISYGKNYSFRHAFRTTGTGTLGDGTATDLGTLGGNFSEGDGISVSGQVVGISLTSGGAEHAFLYTTSMIDLNSLLSISDQAQWELVDATSINNRGQITGMAFVNGDAHAFRLTPNLAPEGSSLLLMGSLLPFVCLALRGRH